MNRAFLDLFFFIAIKVRHSQWFSMHYFESGRYIRPIHRHETSTSRETEYTNRRTRSRTLTFFPRTARIFSRSLKVYELDKLFPCVSNLTKSAPVRPMNYRGIENVREPQTNLSVSFRQILATYYSLKRSKKGGRDEFEGIKILFL